MYQYLKLLEDWDCHDRIFIDLIGKVTNLNINDFSFILWAEDTNIALDCILISSCNLNTDIHYGDTIVVNGQFINGKLRIHTVNKPPFKLSGSLQKDIIILTDTVNSMCSLQQQIEYISSDEREELQEILFDFKDKYHEILFLHSGD